MTLHLTTMDTPSHTCQASVRSPPCVPTRPTKRQKPQQSASESQPLEEHESALDQFDPVQELNSSSEGVVYKVKHRATGTLQVFKMTFPRRGLRFKHGTFPDEVHTLMTLRSLYKHQNVIQIAFAECLPDRCVYCIDYCAAGDLFEQMVRFDAHGVGTPPLFVVQCIIDIGEALAFIHHGLVVDETSTNSKQYRQVCSEPPRITHHDIKPENIFLRLPLNRYGTPSAVLADFGQSTTKPHLLRGGGTRGYLSPEQLDPDKYEAVSTKTDLYATGVTLYDLSRCRRGPSWATGDDPKHLVLPVHLKGFGIDLFLRNCLTVDPRNRFAMDERHGLRYVQIFRGIRERLASRQPIHPRLWSMPAGSKSEVRTVDELDEDIEKLALEIDEYMV